ncbi:MAG: hypothetical protein U5K71_04050 [Gracilimonas sp.]|nr:hypothetical protein [Gracilimonas sp.]
MAGAVYLFVISIVGFGIGPPVTGWLIDHVFTDLYGPSKALLLVFTICGLLATVSFLKAMQHYHEDAVDNEPHPVETQCIVSLRGGVKYSVSINDHQFSIPIEKLQIYVTPGTIISMCHYISIHDPVGPEHPICSLKDLHA